ncbi:MAG: ATP-binding protein [Cyanobacteria bacterium J06642_2]
MKKRSWLPVAVGLCVLVVSLAQWQFLRGRKNKDMKREIELILSTITIELAEQLEERVVALEYLAQPWQQQDRLLPQWEADARKLIDDFGGYRTIAWVDAAERVRWVAPNATNEVWQATQATFDVRRSQVRELTLEGQQVILPGNMLVEPDVLAFIPITSGDRLQGYILGALDIQSLFADGPTFEIFSENFAVSIGRGDVELYRNGDVSVSKYWVAEEFLEFEGVTWQVNVWPRMKFFATHASLLPEAILGFEVLLAVLLPVMIHLERVLRYLNLNLEREVDDRTSRLHKALEFESTLKSIIEKVRNSLDQERIILTSLKELAAVIDAEKCSLVLYDKTHSQVELVYQYPETSVPIDSRQRKDIVTTSTAVQRLPYDHSVQFCELKTTSSHSCRTVLACPVRDDREIVLGDIRIFRHSETAFDRSELNLVEQVADQCAIAIRQANLHQSAKAQVKQLQMLNQLKDDFLNTVSHELRTPLTNLKLALHLMQKAPSEAKQQQYFNLALNQCDREIELVNNLLDLQRLERGRTSAQWKWVDLDRLLHDLIQTAEMGAHDAGQALLVDIPDCLGYFHTDPKFLERALRELLANASKYTDEGGRIDLQVRVAEAGLEFNVINTATLPAETLPHLFEKFYRVSSMDRRNQGGTGLGLSLVKEMVEQLHGKIVVESVNNRTTFSVWLPQQSLMLEDKPTSVELLQNGPKQNYA